MATIRGDQFVLKVRLIDNSFVTVNDLDSFSLGSDRDVNSRARFGNTTPVRVKSARTKSYDVEGMFSPGDPGQDRLRVIEAADVSVDIQVLWDGVNGFQQSVSVASYSFDADPEDIQNYGFALSAEGTATIVGAGPIL